MRKRNKYKRILLVSTNLISQKGFTGVSLQQIADKTGLQKSSLFHYFKSKEELLLRILDTPFDELYRSFQEIIRNNELEPEEKLKRAINNHLIFVLEHRAIANVFLNEIRRLPGKKQRMRNLMKIRKYEKDFEKIIVQMIRKGYFNGLDPKVISFGILGMLNWAIRWFRSNGRLTAKEICTTFYRMVTKI